MRALVLAAAIALAACQQGAAAPLAAQAAAADHPSAEPFDPAIGDSEYAQELDLALASLAVDDAAAPDKALVVFGANWCHDSRALAGWLLDPRMEAAMQHFTVVFIDVGTPQDKRGRNLDLAARFGLDDLRSTPAMVVVDAQGHRLNSVQDAIAWRSADSLGEAEIAAALERYRGL